MDRGFNVPVGTPVYRLLTACYLEDDTVHGEDEEVAYLGVPNEWMEPLNEPAREKMQEYLTHLDQCAERAANAKGRPYTGRLTDIGDVLAQALSDARGTATRENTLAVKSDMVMPVHAGSIPLRGDLATPEQRKRRGRPPKVLASKAPEPQGKIAPRPLSVIDPSAISS